jgi:uncharacterized membrane protein
MAHVAPYMGLGLASASPTERLARLMHPIAIALVQAANLAALYVLSLFALEAWWKVCLFGMAVMLLASALAVRYRRSAVALTVGSLPITWILGVV